MKQTCIAIVDYGVGNLLSVRKALEFTDARVVITRDIEDALTADVLVLPGVGAFKPAMAVLAPYQQRLQKAIQEGLWVFGVCLGFELFFTESTEGGLAKGLDLIPGRIVELPSGVKKPHMGWNTLDKVASHSVMAGIPVGSFFYFVHSYYAETAEDESVVATTKYGVEFPVAVASNRIFGTQFHPEKSGASGLRLLRNFVSIVKESL